jgi:uncharacterized membrane protein YkoI
MKKRNALIIGVIGFIVLGGAIGVGAMDKIHDDDFQKTALIENATTTSTKSHSSTNNSTDDSSTTPTQEGNITQEEAIAIALKESPGTVTKAKLDDDNEYEIEIQDGNKEFDYEINAVTGEIRERDTDFFDDREDD